MTTTTSIPCKGFPQDAMESDTYRMDNHRATEIAHYALDNDLVSGSDRVACERIASRWGSYTAHLSLLIHLDPQVP